MLNVVEDNTECLGIALTHLWHTQWYVLDYYLYTYLICYLAYSYYVTRDLNCCPSTRIYCQRRVLLYTYSIYMAVHYSVWFVIVTIYVVTPGSFYY